MSRWGKSLRYSESREAQRSRRTLHESMQKRAQELREAAEAEKKKQEAEPPPTPENGPKKP